MEQPVLGDGAVLVRPLADRDAALVAALRADRDVQRWLPDGAAPAGAAPGGGSAEAVADGLVDELAEGLAEAVAGGGAARVELAVERDGEPAGAVVLAPDGAGAAWLSAAVLPAHRRRGTAAAGVRLVLTWAFAELGLQVVHWRAEVGAWAARHLAHAVGSDVEGTVRDLLVVGGERRDAWVGSVRWDDPLVPTGRWLVPVPLARGGVHLGRHATGDVERVAQACSAPSTQAWLPTLPSPYTVLDAASHIASREEEHARGAGVYWAVRDAEGLMLAEVGLFRLGPGGRSGEVGYWCHPDARGRGTTTTAVRLVAEHALADEAHGGLGLERLVLRAARGNTASTRVAEKAGFTRVGVDRLAERLRDGTRTDFLRFDLLAEEVETEVVGEVAGEVARRGPGQTGAVSTEPAPGVPTDPASGELPPTGPGGGAPGPSLWRARVVVDLDAPGDADVAAAVADALPLERLPAMAGPDGAAAREDDVLLSSDGSSLEVVLLLQAATDAEAEGAAADAVRTALEAAGLPDDVARPSQVVVEGAYAP